MKYLGLIALLLIGAVATLGMIGTAMGPHQSASASAAPTPTELDQLAAEAHVDVADLEGAANATGLSPRAYLQSVGELPTPTPAPTVKPTATQAPVPTASMIGRVTLKTLRVGMQETFAFDVTNDGATAIDRLALHCACPWDKYTVVGMSPRGTVADGWDGKTFTWSTKLQPGETQTFQVTVSPNVAGNHEFSFRLWDGQHGQLHNTAGDAQIVGTTVAVLS